MKILHITPGSGDSFFCANCLRDAAMVRAIRALGHDIMIVPMYLPGRFDGLEVAGPLFFGGINVFLQQKLALFRHTPRWLDCFFDSPRLLRWASRKSDSTDPADLGETTVSMLAGEDGRQSKELNRLLDWLALPENRADVICLSNVLLAGLAGPVRKRLDIRLMSLLQDEDEFLQALPEPHKSRAWALLHECCEGIDGFISSSRYYADLMRNRLGIAQEKVHTVYNGIAPPADARAYESGGRPARGTPVIGYLSRMSEDKGLDLLAEAFVSLKQNGFPDLKLKVTGGGTGADEGFVRSVKTMLAGADASGDVEFVDDFSPAAMDDFFSDITVLSVPEKKPVSNSLYVLESMSRSIPVVQPDHGIFPEILGMAGGGLLFEPGSALQLAEALSRVIGDPVLALELGRQGRAGASGKFHIDGAAQEIAAIYAGQPRGEEDTACLKSEA